MLTTLLRTSKNAAPTAPAGQRAGRRRWYGQVEESVPLTRRSVWTNDSCSAGL
jgi:hypothetical protein